MQALHAFGVFAGAGFGALLRWRLGEHLNSLVPNLPLGTLAANVLGGFLVGVAMGVFLQFESVPMWIRLMLVTGFLGGLTTFSTFSAEAVGLLARQEYVAAITLVLAHVLCSLAATTCGLLLVRGLVGAGSG